MKKFLAITLAIIITASVATFPTFAEEALFSLTASDEFIIEQETITEGVDYDGPESPLNQFPFLEVIDGTIFASWSEHRDVVICDTADALVMSTDGGKTWTNKQKITNFYATSINKLPDGTLYAMNYNTRFIDEHTMKVFYFTSNDGGLSWTGHEGQVHFDKEITKSQGLWASFAMHRTLMVMDDGSIQGAIYGTYKGDAYSRCVWIKSTDNGQNYYVVSDIGAGVPVGADGTVYDDVESVCEPVVARCLDGSLLAVMRIDSYKPLFYARSYDDGLTWTTPTTLAGIESMGHIWSVDPDLELTSDGTLLLYFGRHDVKVLVSLDGCGYDWQEPAAVKVKGATGYSGIRELEPGKILLIGDYGLPEHTNTPTIWGRYLTLTRRTSTIPTISKLLIFKEDTVIDIDDTKSSFIIKAIDNDGRLIDLEDCEISYSYSNSGVLTADQNGVITPVADGTTEVTVSASYNGTTATSNTLTIDVIDPEAFSYVEASVTADSLLSPGKTIQVNVTPYNRVGEALEGTTPTYSYKSSNTNIATVNSSGLITAVAPGTAEITVSATVSGNTDEYTFSVPVTYSGLVSYDFELDKVGESPNFTLTNPEGHIKVSDTVSASGNNSIYINDNTLSAMVGFRISDTETSAIRHLEFNIYPTNLTDGFNIRFNVNNAYTTYQHKFNITISEDGSVKWYDGSAWNEILPAGTVKLNEWNHVVLSTNVGTKTLTASVNGTEKSQTNACSTHGATAYTMGIELGSGSTAGRACEVYLDDIKMYKNAELAEQVHTLAKLNAVLADESVEVDKTP
ncbi:MAG: exo-alpha-sialidase, partial [Clostridia bacterium]|nr:exo-alpha-sialidase [Clostridia bacterium]